MSRLFEDGLGRQVCYRGCIEDHPAHPAGLGNLYLGRCPVCRDGLLYFVSDGSETPFRCAACGARFRQEQARLLILVEG